VAAYNIAVALWGAYVRASGSGAGCGNGWPLCNGAVMPHSPTIETLIEFTHRFSSGIDLALVALLVLWAFREFPKGHPVRLGAVLSAVFLMTEALIGAALVLLDHVAKNPSGYRAYSLSTHLVNTLTLLGCLTLTAWWSAGNPGLRWTRRAAIVLGAVVLVGISGVIAALGDTLFPARSLAEGLSQDLDRGANIFVRLRWVHPLLAIAVSAGVLWAVTSAPSRRGRRVAGLLGAQVLAGFVNLALLAPVWMQLVHLALAYAFWIALVLWAAETLQKSGVPADKRV
jgi:heme A synthase